MALSQEELKKKYEELSIAADPSVKAWETRKGQAAAGFYKFAASYPKLTEKDNGELRAQIVFTVVEAANKDDTQIGSVGFENFVIPNLKIHADKAKRDAYEGKLKSVLCALRPTLADKITKATTLAPLRESYYTDEEKRARTVYAHYYPYESDADNAQIDYYTQEQWEEILAGKLTAPAKRQGKTDASRGGKAPAGGANAERTKKLAEALDEDEVAPAKPGGFKPQIADDDV